MNTSKLSALRTLIDESGSHRLPSVRFLSALWKCSPTQVQKTLQEARRLGWIETRDRSGSWPSGHLPTPALPVSRNNALTLAADLRDRIQAGHYGGGEKLPSPKTLAAQQGMHPATARKALHSLIRAGLLKRDGRTLSVTPPRRHRAAHPVLWCIGAQDGTGGLRLGSDREWEFWREIQSEAMRNGLQAVHVAWDGKLPTAGGKPLGAIVSTWHIPKPHALLSALHRAQLPSAVWLENPQLTPGQISLRSPWLGYHDMSYGKGSGKLLAQHPVVRRHQRIAWISPFHGAEWSRNRLDGLKKGLPENMRLHEALGPWLSEWDFQTDMWHDQRLLKKLSFKSLGLKKHDSELIRPIIEAMGFQKLFEKFDPILEKALASRSTLWIASSDTIALHCQDWLAARKKVVPKDIALIGFDDTREAFRRGITSFRFDAQAMARAMVRQVLMSDKPSRSIIHYEGTLVARSSTPWNSK